MKDQFQTQEDLEKKLFPFLSLDMVSVEAGHIYMDEEFGEEQFEGFSLATTIIGMLDRNNVQVIPHVLIDDYNALNQELNVEEYLTLVNSFGFKDPKVTMESSLTQNAEMYLDQLIQEDIAKLSPKCSYNLKRTNGPMLKHSNGKYSCSLLDATYLKDVKLLGVDASITVLPLSYKSQQKNMKLIAKSLGVHPNKHEVIYF